MEEIKILLSSGLVAYIIKSIFEFYLRKKEIRNNTFYNVKTKKVIELHKKIVDIQVLLDRGGQYPLNEINDLGKGKVKSFSIIKYEMDLDFWEADFYYSKETSKYLKLLIQNISFYTTPDFVKENPNIDVSTKIIIKKLLRCLKKEISS